MESDFKAIQKTGKQRTDNKDCFIYDEFDMSYFQNYFPASYYFLRDKAKPVSTKLHFKTPYMPQMFIYYECVKDNILVQMSFMCICFQNKNICPLFSRPVIEYESGAMIMPNT